MLSHLSTAQVSTPNFVEQSVQQQRYDITWDWLQLTSGEWLKGRIKVMYSDILQFDSDELDLLDIELDDISQLYSSGPQSVRIEGIQEPLTGLIEIQNKRIYIQTVTGSEDYSVDDIVAMASGTKSEKDLWSIRFGIGVNLRGGNAPQTEYNSNLSLKRRTAKSRYMFDYLGLYTKTKETETANNHRILSSYDTYATTRLFYRPILAELIHDPFQNIDIKGTIGTGVGYTFINNSKTDWDVFVGPGYQFTTFDEVEPDESKRERSFALIMNTKLDTEISSRVDYINDYQIKYVDSKSGGYTHHLVVSFEFELTGSIDLDTQFVWDFTQFPTADSTGSEPDKSDTRLLFTLSYEFN